MPDLDIAIVFGIMALVVLGVVWYMIRKFFGLVVIIGIVCAFVYFYPQLNHHWHQLGGAISEAIETGDAMTQRIRDGPNSI